MRVIGVDEHAWRHTPYGDKYITLILDVTPIRDHSGPSRLLDMVPTRSKKVFKTGSGVFNCLCIRLLFERIDA